MCNFSSFFTTSLKKSQSVEVIKNDYLFFNTDTYRISLVYFKVAKYKLKEQFKDSFEVANIR